MATFDCMWMDPDPRHGHGGTVRTGQSRPNRPRLERRPIDGPSATATVIASLLTLALLLTMAWYAYVAAHLGEAWGGGEVSCPGHPAPTCLRPQITVRPQPVDTVTPPGVPPLVRDAR